MNDTCIAVISIYKYMNVYMMCYQFCHNKYYSNYYEQVYIEKKTFLYLLCDDYVLSITDGTSVSTFLCTPGA